MSPLFPFFLINYVTFAGARFIRFAFLNLRQRFLCHEGWKGRRVAQDRRIGKSFSFAQRKRDHPVAVFSFVLVALPKSCFPPFSIFSSDLENIFFPHLLSFSIFSVFHSKGWKYFSALREAWISFFDAGLLKFEYFFRVFCIFLWITEFFAGYLSFILLLL